MKLLIFLTLTLSPALAFSQTAKTLELPPSVTTYPCYESWDLIAQLADRAASFAPGEDRHAIYNLMEYAVDIDHRLKDDPINAQLQFCGPRLNIAYDIAQSWKTKGWLPTQEEADRQKTDRLAKGFDNTVPVR